jgi:DNA polymerase-3 subunit alpha
VTIAGQLNSVEKKFTKKEGKPFAVVVLEDLTGQLEVMVWNEAYTKAQKHLEAGKVITITGRLDLRDEGPRVAADKIEPLAKPTPKEKPLILTLDRKTAAPGDFETIRQIISKHPGPRKFEFRIVGGDRPLRVVPDDGFGVNFDQAAKTALAPWLR